MTGVLSFLAGFAAALTATLLWLRAYDRSAPCVFEECCNA